MIRNKDSHISKLLHHMPTSFLSWPLHRVSMILPPLTALHTPMPLGSPLTPHTTLYSASLHPLTLILMISLEPDTRPTTDGVAQSSGSDGENQKPTPKWVLKCCLCYMWSYKCFEVLNLFFAAFLFKAWLKTRLCKIIYFEDEVFIILICWVSVAGFTYSYLHLIGNCLFLGYSSIRTIFTWNSFRIWSKNKLYLSSEQTNRCELSGILIRAQPPVAERCNSCSAYLPSFATLTWVNTKEKAQLFHLSSSFTKHLHSFQDLSLHLLCNFMRCLLCKVVGRNLNQCSQVEQPYCWREDLDTLWCTLQFIFVVLRYSILFGWFLVINFVNL